MAERYPELKISDYIYTPESGSASHLCHACGHRLHFAPQTRVVVMCPDCEAELEHLRGTDPRCVKIVTKADEVKAEEIAKADIKKDADKKKARSYFRTGRKED